MENQNRPPLYLNGTAITNAAVTILEQLPNGGYKKKPGSTLTSSHRVEKAWISWSHDDFRMMIKGFPYKDGPPIELGDHMMMIAKVEDRASHEYRFIQAIGIFLSADDDVLICEPVGLPVWYGATPCPDWSF
jgi:hypothetical protein